MLRLTILVAALAATCAACGASASVSGSEIIDALKLEETSEGYAMEGDLFCQVSKLLNDSDEVEQAADAQAPMVISRDATLGVEVVKPFAPDCELQARQSLNRLERRTEG